MTSLACCNWVVILENGYGLISLLIVDDIMTPFGCGDEWLLIGSLFLLSN